MNFSVLFTDDLRINFKAWPLTLVRRASPAGLIDRSAFLPAHGDSPLRVLRCRLASFLLLLVMRQLGHLRFYGIDTSSLGHSKETRFRLVFFDSIDIVREIDFFFWMCD